MFFVSIRIPDDIHVYIESTKWQFDIFCFLYIKMQGFRFPSETVVKFTTNDPLGEFSGKEDLIHLFSCMEYATGIFIRQSTGFQAAGEEL